MDTPNHKTYIQVVDGEVGEILLKETSSALEFIHWIKCRNPFTKFVYTSMLDANGVDLHTTCTGFRPTYEDLVDLARQIDEDLWELDDGRIFCCRASLVEKGKWLVYLANPTEELE